MLVSRDNPSIPRPGSKLHPVDGVALRQGKVWLGTKPFPIHPGVYFVPGERALAFPLGGSDGLLPPSPKTGPEGR